MDAMLPIAVIASLGPARRKANAPMEIVAQLWLFVPKKAINMPKFCLWLGAFFFIFGSCKPVAEKHALPDLLDLSIIDSTLTGNELFFMNVTDQVKLIGDSLLAISSIRTPAVGIVKMDGKQVGNIASGDFPIGSFMPGSYDISDYPIVYIIDRRSQSVLIFNVASQKFIEKVRLHLPNDKIIRTIGTKFKKIESGYVVELLSQKHDAYLPAFYRESGDLLYFFDTAGVIQKKIVEYPEEYKVILGSLQPANYLTMGDDQESLLISFPHQKKIFRYSLKGEVLEEIELPRSRFFDYQLKAADRIIDATQIMAGGNVNLKTPANNIFNSIREDERHIYVETWMKIGEGGIKETRFAHLMVYNKDEKKWYETSNPRNILDIGMLAGVVNDTLYFYEGSLMKSDEKYIKRAILKPIKE